MVAQTEIVCLCMFCNLPFDTESEKEFKKWGKQPMGHYWCSDFYEKWTDLLSDLELMADCPPGTRFDLASGAACD